MMDFDRDEAQRQHHQNIKDRDDKLYNYFVKPSIITMTKLEVEKTNKVNKLTDQLAALNSLRERQREMDLNRRKSIQIREADDLNLVALENHRMQKNNQILKKHQDKV